MRALRFGPEQPIARVELAPNCLSLIAAIAWIRAKGRERNHRRARVLKAVSRPIGPAP